MNEIRRTVTTLLALPECERDAQLSPVAREAVLASIITDPTGRKDLGLASLAIGLCAYLGEIKVLTPGELLLLTELLNRLSRSGDAD